MKPLLTLFVLGSLTGCMAVEDGAAPAASNPLPSDAHYVVVPVGYPTPEACLANDPQPFACQDSLSLCRNGRAGQRVGDLVYQGTYSRDGSIVHVSFDDGETMEFDVQTVTQLDAPSVHWIVDTERRWETLQFDNIGCERD